MFLVTIINPDTAQLLRRVFLFLEDAERYMDYVAGCRITIWELVRVDTTLSDLFETSGG